MKSVFKPILMSALIASAALTAYAQADATAPAKRQGMHHHHMDPAKVQELIAKRQAEELAQRHGGEPGAL